MTVWCVKRPGNRQCGRLADTWRHESHQNSYYLRGMAAPMTGYLRCTTWRAVADTKTQDARDD